MTSRSGTLVENGARELLQVYGYTTRVIPFGFNKHLPPAHLVASRGPDETRYIKIRKISRLSPCIGTIQTQCTRDLVQFRRHLARLAGETGLRCEIRIYSLYHGFRCFDLQKDSVRESPPPVPDNPAPLQNGGVS